MVGCYEMNEASGNNALDAHTNGYTLTQVNTPGTAAGVISTSRSFISGASQHFISTDSAFNFSTNLTISTWVYLTSTGINRALISKYLVNGAGTNFNLSHVSASTQFRFQCYDSSGVSIETVNSAFGAPQPLTWYHILAWINNSATEIGMTVNGAFTTTAVTTGTLGVFGTSDFSIGRFSTTYQNGRIDQSVLWAGVPIYNMAQRMYNSGSGLPYSSFT